MVFPVKLISTAPLKRFFQSTAIPMAGHNKWSKIRHKKGESDAKRSLQFSRLGKEIMAAMKGSISILFHPERFTSYSAGFTNA
jgi:hypothetical protein